MLPAREIHLSAVLRLLLDSAISVCDVHEGGAFQRFEELDMGKHYTRATQSVSKYCKKCKTHTQHRVTDRRVNDCIPCMEKQEEEHLREKAKGPKARQDGFDF